MTDNSEANETASSNETETPHNLGTGSNTAAGDVSASAATDTPTESVVPSAVTPELAAPSIDAAELGSPSSLSASETFPQQPVPTATHTDPKLARAGGPKAGILIAGIAAGALVGGIAGAGVTAVTLSQMSTENASSYSRDALTISNPDEATTVSAIAANATPSVVTLEVSNSSGAGTGSGVIIDPTGYILTNNHVVTLESGATDAAIRVVLSDGRILPGKLVGTDPYADLAVVKIDEKNLPAVTFANSEKLNVGDLTVAIGAPLNLANTVTSGVISALNRGITVGSTEVDPAPSEEPANPNDMWNFDTDPSQQNAPAVSGSITIPVIQTDASINPGNSGGALLNAKGQLIGINVAIASTATGSDTAGSVGLGFAIPSNLAKRVSDSLIAGEKVSHGKLGVSVGDASGDADAVQSGALVKEVTPGGPAAKAGIQKGDVITSVDGVPVMDGTSLSALVRYFPAGTDVKLEFIRGGKVNTATVTLGSL